MATRTQITQALAVLGAGIGAAIEALNAPPTPDPAPVSDEPAFLDGVLASITGMIDNVDAALGRHVPSITPPMPLGSALETPREPAINPVSGRVE